jgi:hypothetical protein
VRRVEERNRVNGPELILDEVRKVSMGRAASVIGELQDSWHAKPLGIISIYLEI